MSNSSYLQRFIDDEGLVKAVKEEIFRVIDNLLPVINPTDSDEIIGQRTRAYTTARGLIERAFSSMEQHKGRKTIISQHLER